MNLPIPRVRSLKVRLTLSTLAIFLVCMWSLSFYISRNLRSDIEQMAGQQQLATVTFAADDINQELVERQLALNQVAATLTRMDNPTNLQSHLEELPVFLNLFNDGSFIVGTDGITIASVPRSAHRVGVSYADRDFVVAALRDGRASIGSPVLGKQSHAPIVVMAHPIRNAQGKVIGAVMGVTNLATPNFLEEVSRATYGKSGGYFLIDRKRRLVVTASDKSRIMSTVGNSPPVNRFINGYEGSEVFIHQTGVEVLASAKSIPAANWYLALNLPTAEVFRRCRRCNSACFGPLSYLAPSPVV